jgi:hypothetical protein
MSPSTDVYCPDGSKGALALFCILLSMVDLQHLSIPIHMCCFPWPSFRFTFPIHARVHSRLSTQCMNHDNRSSTAGGYRCVTTMYVQIKHVHVRVRCCLIRVRVEWKCMYMNLYM